MKIYKPNPVTGEMEVFESDPQENLRYHVSPRYASEYSGRKSIGEPFGPGAKSLNQVNIPQPSEPFGQINRPSSPSINYDDADLSPEPINVQDVAIDPVDTVMSLNDPIFTDSKMIAPDSSNDEINYIDNDLNIVQQVASPANDVQGKIGAVTDNSYEFIYPDGEIVELPIGTLPSPQTKNKSITPELDIYTELGMNPDLQEGFFPGTVDAPYHGNTRTIMTPTDTITYNTNNPLIVGKEQIDGFFVGTDQNGNPVILGSSKLSKDNYYDHVNSDIGKDWGVITSPKFTGGHLDISGDYLKGDINQGIFSSEDKDHTYRIYSGEGIKEEFPELYNELKDLGYYNSKDDIISTDYGLFQINDFYHSKEKQAETYRKLGYDDTQISKMVKDTKKFGKNWKGNIKYAKHLSEAEGWDVWTSYNNKSYEQFLNYTDQDYIDAGVKPEYIDYINSEFDNNNVKIAKAVMMAESAGKADSINYNRK